MIKTAFALIAAIHRWYVTTETKVLVVMPDGSEWFIDRVERVRGPTGHLLESVRLVCKKEKLPAPSYATPLPVDDNAYSQGVDR